MNNKNAFWGGGDNFLSIQKKPRKAKKQTKAKKNKKKIRRV